MPADAFALLLLCALAAPAFAAEAAMHPLRRSFALAIPALVLPPALLSTGLRLDISAVALSSAAAAVVFLVWPPLRRVFTGLTAGGASGFTLVLLLRQAIPWPMAVALACIPAGLAGWLARERPRFAPLHVRDEAFIVLLAIGLGVAVLPSVIDGWQAAVRLNVSGEAQSLAVPVWTLMLASAAVALGGGYAAWRHR